VDGIVCEIIEPGDSADRAGERRVSGDILYSLTVQQHRATIAQATDVIFTAPNHYVIYALLFAAQNFQRARELEMGEEWTTDYDPARTARYGTPWIP
jgi:hypothetical protein